MFQNKTLNTLWEIGNAIYPFLIFKRQDTGTVTGDGKDKEKVAKVIMGALGSVDEMINAQIWNALTPQEKRRYEMFAKWLLKNYPFKLFKLGMVIALMYEKDKAAAVNTLRQILGKKTYEDMLDSCDIARLTLNSNDILLKGIRNWVVSHGGRGTAQVKVFTTFILEQADEQIFARANFALDQIHQGAENYRQMSFMQKIRFWLGI